MLSPNFLRCKETVVIPYTFTRADGTPVPTVSSRRIVRCAWPRTHGAEIKHSFRFNDPGSLLPSYEERVDKARALGLLLYMAFIILLAALGVMG